MGSKIGHPFVICWTDSTFSTASESLVSRMFDLADCGDMEDVAEILALGHDGRLQAVHRGEPAQVEDDTDESPVVYAVSPILTADGKHVGTVFHTDH